MKFVIFPALLALVSCASPPASTCRSNSDCSDGDICAADGTCVASTSVGEGEGEAGEGEGEAGEGEGEVGEGEGEVGEGEGEGEGPVLDLTPRIVDHGVVSGAGTSGGRTFNARQRITSGTATSRGTSFTATQKL